MELEASRVFAPIFVATATLGGPAAHGQPEGVFGRRLWQNSLRCGSSAALYRRCRASAIQGNLAWLSTLLWWELEARSLARAIAPVAASHIAIGGCRGLVPVRASMHGANANMLASCGRKPMLTRPCVQCLHSVGIGLCQSALQSSRACPCDQTSA